MAPTPTPQPTPHPSPTHPDTIHLELLDDLDLPDPLRAEAAAWLREIEPAGFVRGILPPVWVETLRQARGDAAATTLTHLIAQLDGPFTIGRPMRQRDILLSVLAFWRMAWPDLPLVDGCRQVVRASIKRIVTSPGFGMLLKVVDQGLADIAVMSELIAKMMTSFDASLPTLHPHYVEMRLRNVSLAFPHLCVSGYFLGMLDLCGQRGAVRCERLPDSIMLTIDARPEANPTT